MSKYQVYVDGDETYYYTSFPEKFVVELKDSVQTSDLQPKLDSLGILLEFDSEVSRHVCRKKDGTAFDKVNCEEIATIRSMDEVQFCAVIMKLEWTIKVEKSGNTEKYRNENTYWFITGWANLHTVNDYGQDKSVVDSIISANQLTPFTLEENIYSPCKMLESHPLSCAFKFPAEYTYECLDAAEEINRNNTEVIKVELISL